MSFSRSQCVCEWRERVCVCEIFCMLLCNQTRKKNKIFVSSSRCNARPTDQFSSIYFGLHARTQWMCVRQKKNVQLFLIRKILYFTEIICWQLFLVYFCLSFLMVVCWASAPFIHRKIFLIYFFYFKIFFFTFWCRPRIFNLERKISIQIFQFENRQERQDKNTPVHAEQYPRQLNWTRPNTMLHWHSPFRCVLFVRSDLHTKIIPTLGPYTQRAPHTHTFERYTHPYTCRNVVTEIYTHCVCVRQMPQAHVRCEWNTQNVYTLHNNMNFILSEWFSWARIVLLAAHTHTLSSHTCHTLHTHRSQSNTLEYRLPK